MNKEYIFFLKYNLNIRNMFDTFRYSYHKIIHLIMKRLSKKSYPKKYLFIREVDLISKYNADIKKLFEHHQDISNFLI